MWEINFDLSYITDVESVSNEQFASSAQERMEDKMKRDVIKHEHGFTLLEVIVAVMIIGVVGTLVLQTIVKANTSMEISNVQTFMDNITQSAKEAYKADPETVLFKDIESTIYPFSSMARTTNVTNADTNTGTTTYSKKFTKTYSSNLFPLSNETDPNSKYKVEITFVPITKQTSISAPGFEYKAVEYKMESRLYTKDKNDAITWNVEPLYDKSYSFDNIAVKDHTSSGISYATVKFDPNGGRMVPADAPVEIDKIVGDDIGEIIHKAQKGDQFFMGWSTDKTSAAISSKIIDSNYKVSGDVTLYAKYLNDEYAVKFEIDPGIQSFNVPNIENPKIEAVNMGIQTSNPNVKIQDVKAQNGKLTGSDMFMENAVSQQGKAFVGWADVSGKPYKEDDKVDPPYLILKPIMEDAKEETINVIVNLNIENSTVLNTKTGVKFNHVVYPYTNSDFVISVENGNAHMLQKNFQKKSAEGFIKEIDASALHLTADNPESVYDSKINGGEVKFSEKDGLTYTSFEEFYNNSEQVKRAKKNGANQLRIKTSLRVQYAGIDMDSYTNPKSVVDEKDPIKTRSGSSTVSDAQLTKVFNGSENPSGSAAYSDEGIARIKDIILKDKSIKRVNIDKSVGVNYESLKVYSAMPYTVGSGEIKNEYDIMLTMPTGYLKRFPFNKGYGFYLNMNVSGMRVSEGMIQIRIGAKYKDNKMVAIQDNWVNIMPEYEGNVKNEIRNITMRGELVCSVNSFTTTTQFDGRTIQIKGISTNAYSGNLNSNAYIQIPGPPSSANYYWTKINYPFAGGPTPYVRIEYLTSHQLNAAFVPRNFGSTTNSNINFREHIKTTGSATRNILTFAPNTDELAVLPYWLKSTRKTT